MTYVPYTGKVAALLMLAIATLAAVISYSRAFEYTVSGIALYTLLAIALARYIDKHANWEEAYSAFLLALFSTTGGAVIGAVLSRSLYSLVTAMGIALSSTIYSILAIREESR